MADGELWGECVEHMSRIATTREANHWRRATAPVKYFQLDIFVYRDELNVMR